MSPEKDSEKLSINQPSNLLDRVLSQWICKERTTTNLCDPAGANDDYLKSSRNGSPRRNKDTLVVGVAFLCEVTFFETVRMVYSHLSDDHLTTVFVQPQSG